MSSLGSLFSTFLPPKYKERIQAYSPGDIIGGRYLVLSKNPTAPGHGNVFFCHDMWDKHPCVLKEIHASNYEEAKRFATIPFHENVVKLWRVEVIGGSIMLVQEWLPDTLANHMNDSFSGKEIEDIILSICRGLGHCVRYLSVSNKVFVHGDIKPDNLFISTDGTMKLADFGGGYTLEYASPEQLRQEKADHRSDIYSIGKVLEKLCLKCTDPSRQQKLLLIARKCMSPSAKDRFESLDALHKEISGAHMKYADCHKLTPAQLCNLSRIGQQINIYQLSNQLSSADSDELCDIAEILVNVGLTHSAIDTYGMSLFKKTNARAFAGIARAESMMMNWDHAILNSSEALKLNSTDYQSMYIHINALYNQAVKKIGGIEHLFKDNEKNTDENTISAYIDYAPGSPEVRKNFTEIEKKLEFLHKKYPKEIEPLKLLGYVNSILGNDQKAILYYKDYLAKIKDDYESAFLYAIRLYLANDITESIKHFKSIGDFIENSESKSLVRGSILLYCRYFSNDIEGFNNALAYLDAILDFMSEEEKDEHPGELLKIAIIEKCNENDYEEYFPYVSKLNNIARQIQSRSSYDTEWCLEQLRQIADYREEWSKLHFSELSILYRKLNIQSYDYESFFYEILGDRESVLGCVDKMLKYDHSLCYAQYNRAVTLVNLERYVEAIPSYRRAFECETDSDKCIQIKQEENNILVYLYEHPDSFFEFLLKKAYTWYGSRPVELESIIKDYRIMFSKQMCDWLSVYAQTLVDKVISFSLSSEAFDPLLNLLEALHDVSIPDFDEDDSFEIEIPMSPSVKCGYQFRKPSDLSEYTLPVLNILIKAGEDYGIPNLLFNSLRLRGELYYDRKQENRTENLKNALADFNKIMELPESSLPIALPHVAWAAHYAGKINIELNRPETAKPYLDMAMSIYTKVGNRLNEGRVHFSWSICHFKENNLKNAAIEATKALECITLDDNRNVFAKAKYILGLVSAIALDSKSLHAREIIDEGIDAFDSSLIVFKENSAEWFVSMSMISSLYSKKNELFHDGNWALADYYKKKVCNSVLNNSDTLDFLGIKISAWIKIINQISAP